MERVWSAEVEVDAKLAAELIEAQFPALAPARVEPYGVGWDNVAYRVNDLWIFRFPRRSIAVPLIATEHRILPAIDDWLQLPVPVPVHLGAASERYPWAFSGYRELGGVTLDRARLAEEQRARLAEPLGAFLASLHAFPIDRARTLGVPDDELGRLDVPRRRALTKERLLTAAALGLIDHEERLHSLLAAAPDGFVPRTDRLVHGDLYARHLLVDPDGALSGVIDWGDVHVGDPAVDLAVALEVLPFEAHEAFRRAYGDPIDESAWAVATLRALHHAIALLLYAVDTADADLEAEARWSLHSLRRIAR